MNPVTVIIPNYNGIGYVERCLDSLRNQTFRDFDVIIVDNASRDGSRELIQKKYPEFRLYRLKENYGFAGATNFGIKHCTSDFVIFLNNDTWCEPDFIGNLYKAIKKNPKLFSVSSKMVKIQDENIMDDAGDLYTIVGWSLQRGTREPAKDYCKPKKVFSACGGAAIYRMEILKEIGILDSLHFAYLEDLDLGYRAKVFGYSNSYCPTAIVHHIGSASTGGTLYNDFKVRISARNSVYLNYKNMPDWQLVLNLPFLAFGYLVKYYFFRNKGYGEAYVEGLKEGLFSSFRCKRVDSEKRYFWIDLKIEWELIWNTVLLAKHYYKLRKMK